MGVAIGLATQTTRTKTTASTALPPWMAGTDFQSRYASTRNAAKLKAKLEGVVERAGVLERYFDAMEDKKKEEYAKTPPEQRSAASRQYQELQERSQRKMDWNKLPERSSKTCVIIIDPSNVGLEIDTVIPVVMLFTRVSARGEEEQYAEQVVNQARLANSQRAPEIHDMPFATEGPDRGLALKLCVIDVDKYEGVAQRFQVTTFPCLLFVYRQLTIDYLTHVASESHVKECFDRFIQYVRDDIAKSAEESQDSQSSKTVTGTIQKGRREKSADAIGRSGLKTNHEDEENPMTLLQAANKQIIVDPAKSKKLFMKAFDLSIVEVMKLRDKLGFDTKKVTDEMNMEMRRFGPSNCCAQALAGLSLVALADGNVDEAQEICAQLQQDFPYAREDIGSVREAICRIDILRISKLDLTKDNYMSLLKFDDLINDPVTFYLIRVKLVAAHVMQRCFSSAFEELARLLRVEPRILPALQAEGLAPPNGALTSLKGTPARDIAKVMLEMGTTEDREKGKKMIGPYI